VIKRGYNPDELTVLLVAPAGKAAQAVHGMTVHAAFSLPLSQSGNKMSELSAGVANRISSHFINVKAIIFDEISMYGAQQFYSIHHRLQQIFRTNTYFGGLSMFLFGNFRNFLLLETDTFFVFHLLTQLEN
jgi:PIF1 helicase.